MNDRPFVYCVIDMEDAFPHSAALAEAVAQDAACTVDMGGEVWVAVHDTDKGHEHARVVTDPAEIERICAERGVSVPAEYITVLFIKCSDDLFEDFEDSAISNPAVEYLQSRGPQLMGMAGVHGIACLLKSAHGAGRETSASDTQVLYLADRTDLRPTLNQFKRLERSDVWPANARNFFAIASVRTKRPVPVPPDEEVEVATAAGYGLR
ncbi:MAG: hypothetical protein AB7G06_05580 [Bdellovibrionales bacterium]